MSYYDVYQSRINHMGTSTAERIRNGGIRSFQKWLAQSPHTLRDLSVQRGIYFDGIVLTNKDKQHEKIMFLNVSNDIPITVGDIMNWKLDSGEIQKWLLIQEQKKTNGTYRTFWIVRCNYLMKWVDSNGHLQQSWSYFVSSLDSKIKGNFRTWNRMISPQPNKYAELLMPRYPIERATNFIVEQQSWTVVEYDHTSVPGVIYLSLTEGKINSIYDDVENNIADTDKLANYDLLLPQTEQRFKVGDVINPVFTLTKNGIPIDEPVDMISTNKQVVKLVNNELTAVGAGEVEIILRLQNYPTIEQRLTVNVTAEEQEFSAFIDGPDTLRLDNNATYTLVGTSEITSTVIFTIDNESLATIVKDELKENSCVVRANKKNLLEKFTLTATYQGRDYAKTISIIPLW